MGSNGLMQSGLFGVAHFGAWRLWADGVMDGVVGFRLFGVRALEL